MSRTIKTTASVLLAIEIIASIVLGNGGRYDFQWGIFLAGALVSFVSFLLFYSVGVIIEHLENINSTMKLLRNDLLNNQRKAMLDQQQLSQGFQTMQGVAPTASPLPTAREEVVPAKVDPLPEPGQPIAPIVVNEYTVKCPLCGTLQKSGRKICFHCGNPFVQ